MRRPPKLLVIVAVVALLTLGSPEVVSRISAQEAADPAAITVFPGTEPLTWEGDLASRLVEVVDANLLERWEAQRAARFEQWQAALAGEQVSQFLQERREELRYRLGIHDQPNPLAKPSYRAPVGVPTVLAKTAQWQARYVTWPAFGGVEAEGILVEPTSGAVRAQVIAVPDADVPPEDWVWQESNGELRPGVAGLLAEQGCRVLVPALINRKLERRNGRANLTSREFVYRPAFELGRHLIGFEVQELLSARQWLAELSPAAPIGLFGYGEGGHLALFAGALDEGFASVMTSGHFSTEQNLWQQPLDRNVFGRMLRLGDAELAALIWPRQLSIEIAEGPHVDLPSEGGAPATLSTPDYIGVKDEIRRYGVYSGLLNTALSEQLKEPLDGELMVIEVEDGGPLSSFALKRFLGRFADSRNEAPQADDSESDATEIVVEPTALVADADRQQRLVQAMIAHTQQLLVESPYVRQAYMKELDTSSLAAYEKSVESYREKFRHEVIGDIGEELKAPAPRTRQAYAGKGWTGYEVVLDVFDDVFAYGILLWPDDIGPDEKRPVVVCQHGLEGRPQDIIQGDHPAYHDFAAKLAEQGYIVFAPQNIYIFQDRFRTLQRKANPLGLTLFSVMVPQHQQICNWLEQQKNVDPDRIAFYGLSYGGKSAMRLPALVKNYCLSICSADFNEWVWKNASTRSPYSYVWTGEYEIFEFDLGSTFNYSEMAALIAPRPFMVERGHFDGVAPDETVGYEFAKVRHLYAAKLGIPERCEIEWFVGPHTINGQGTYRFLRRHLNWPSQP